MQDRTLRPVKLLQGVLLIIQAAEFRSFREREARGLGGVIDVGGTEALSVLGTVEICCITVKLQEIGNQDGRH